MRSGLVVMLMLTAAFVAACGQEVNRPEPDRRPEVPKQAEQPTPAVPTEEVSPPTNEDKLRSLGSDASTSEVGILCLRLRAAYASGSFPSDLRQRCARSMLTLAEISESTTKSADEWLNLAEEFGASSTDIKKIKRSVAASISERSETQAENGGTKIENESYASPDDVRQAREFLASLPEACNGSHASASRDGAVTIRVSCEGNNKSMSGSIKIKDGIVTEIQ